MASKAELDHQFEKLLARNALAKADFRYRTKQRAYRDELLQQLGLKAAGAGAVEPQSAAGGAVAGGGFGVEPAKD